ncbi:iron donor protein [Plasmopara halstedii]|uniref:ferroxidase n=1 Tax=Plasmopara halstedii TaxID=4781 RepID=A0A0P1AHL8_PLAHL|nr:iron donor protein [Plasmopara halstedii]CEG40620.1 iron donor protein [Plasmopara halstedii]|eukprot:XP_024576989.1 iron donor protein [Plasmopara halstedii]
MTEHEFMELADKTLFDIQSWLDGIEEMLEECDVMFSVGVLKIDLGEYGTWVINRQVPNRQIWWSSPISGPRRYEYDAERRAWVNTRDKGELKELLHTEILEATGIEIYT